MQIPLRDPGCKSGVHLRVCAGDGDQAAWPRCPHLPQRPGSSPLSESQLVQALLARTEPHPD
eukprot:1202233-Rhodomonas_salina.3